MSHKKNINSHEFVFLDSKIGESVDSKDYIISEQGLESESQITIGQPDIVIEEE